MRRARSLLFGFRGAFCRAFLCSFLGSFLGGFLVLIGVSPCRADITDLMRFLRPVQLAPRTLTQSPPRKLLFNGFPLHVMSGRTPESIDEVLNFYERSFSREPDGKPTQPMQRQRGKDFGSLMTVDTTLLAALQAMKRRQHYATSAPLRMVYAHRVDEPPDAAAPERGGPKTDYLAIWSEEAVSQDVLAPPRDRDAPGMDAPDTPRPPAGLRSFNMYEPASGYLIVSYEVPAPPQAALESTLLVLRGAGFLPDPGFAAAASAKGKRVVRLERAGGEDRDLIVSVQPKRGEPDACTVTYLMRRR